MTGDVIDEAAADTCAKLGRGRDRCLATWLSLLNMRYAGAQQ